MTTTPGSDGKPVYGRVFSVSEVPLGSKLVGDHAAGTSTLTVTNPADFLTTDGTGKVSVNGQVLPYSAVDETTGVLTLSGSLSEDADDGDAAAVYDSLFDKIALGKQALVTFDGDEGTGDPIPAAIAHNLVPALPEGTRGVNAEAVILELEHPDGTHWRITGIVNQAHAAQLRFYDQDTYTVTAADIVAQSITAPLTYQPEEGSVHVRWGVLPQPPTEYDIDYEARTVSMSLDLFVEAGDEMWFMYAYRDQPRASDAIDYLFVPLGFSWKYKTGLGSSTSYAQPGFDDSTWSMGSTPFGWGDPGVPVTWNTVVPEPMAVWMRLMVETNGGDLTFIFEDVDDDSWVYLDGVLVQHVDRTSPDAGTTAGSFTTTCPAGQHVVAVYGTDAGDTGSGPQKGYVGFAIQEETP